MQLNTIRARVRALSNIRSSSILPDADIDEYVNDFTKMLCESYDWPQFIGTAVITTTTASSYNYPADARNIISVAVRLSGREIPLTAVGSRELDLAGQSGETVPAIYGDDPAARKIKIVPGAAPGFQLVVRFHKNPPTLVQGSDVPPFDAEYHLAWATAAAASALRERSGDPQKAQYFESKTGEIISRMRRRYLMSRDREPMALLPRW